MSDGIGMSVMELLHGIIIALLTANMAILARLSGTVGKINARLAAVIQKIGGIEE